MGFEKPYKSGEMERKEKAVNGKPEDGRREHETEEREQKNLKKSFLKLLYFDNLLIYPRKTSNICTTCLIFGMGF